MVSKSLKKSLIIPAAFLLALCLVAIVPNLAQAGTTSPHGISQTAETAGLSELSSDLPTIIGGLVRALLGLVGIIFLVLMIYAGFLWMTSAGNEETVKKAKNMITGAVIGMIIIFAAYAITNFVFNAVIPNTGSTEGGTMPEEDPLESAVSGE